MQVESPEQIRNLAVAGHNDTGKTTLLSALLYAGGVSNRLNRVEDGNTVTDFDSEEIARTISIGMAPCFVPWRQHKLNFVDCPGYGIFLSETRTGMRACDNTLLCINGVAGVEVNSERIWNFAERIGQPVIFHLTKMDRERADFERVLAELQEHFDRAVVPVHLPIGAEDGFKGIVDLVHKKAYLFERDGNGKAQAGEIPAEMADAVEAARSQLVEAVAETDDLLLETFFDEGGLDQGDLVQGLRNAIAGRKLFPVTVSAGVHAIGPSALLDFLVDAVPAPSFCKPFPATDGDDKPIELEADPAAPLAALVFKTLSDPYSGKITIFRVLRGTFESDSTVWNSRLGEGGKVGTLMAMQGKQGSTVAKLVAGDIGGVAKLKETGTGDTLCAKEAPVKADWVAYAEPGMSFAVEPKSKGDEEKIGEALTRLIDEDPSLRAGRDPRTGEYLLSGAGQLHVEITVAKLKSRFKVEVVLHPPTVPYVETVVRAADGHGRHKKQSGGRGQFADCKIKLEPLPRGGDFEFADEIFGGSIPQSYRPAVEKGILEARDRGFLAGYPVVDFKVRLLDGQYHDVDSSEMAFKIAGSLAFKDAMAKAGATILEPVMKVEITTTEEYMGDIMSDLSQRRGRPQGMETRGCKQIINAVVPMAEMLEYARALRAITQGRGSFHMEMDSYAEVPRDIQKKLIAGAKPDDDDS